MKQELDRIKSDVETMQKAMGLAPSMAREWVQWMKRDRWFSLWWCLPGLIIIAAAFLPSDHAQRYLGLVPAQWAGILAAASLLGIAVGHSRQVAGKDGRPEGMARESRRTYGMTDQGLRFGLAMAVQFALYFVWGIQNHVAFQAFWTGLFVAMGSSCLAGALVARSWILLGYALPFIGYGFCFPLANGDHKAGGILLGMMFVAVALLFSFIQSLQIRQVEAQDESH